MPTVSGKRGIIKVSTNVVAEITGYSIEEEASTEEATNLNDSDEKHDFGRRRWRADIEAHYDPADADGQEALATGAELAQINFYPDGDQSSAKYRQGAGVIVGNVISTQLTPQKVAARFQVMGNGPLQRLAVS